MEYTKVLLRAELCTVAAAAMYARDIELTNKLNKAIYEAVHNIPAPSTGAPLAMHKDEVMDLRIDHTVIVPTEETIKNYEFNQAGDNVYICVRVLGIIFETGNTDDVEHVMNSLAKDPKVSEFNGLGWKYFDPATDIPKSA